MNPLQNNTRNRIWSPTIPSCPIDTSLIDPIINKFVSIIEKKEDDTNYKNPFFTPHLTFGTDIRLVNEIKYQFESTALRKIDFKLINEMARLKKETELLMIQYVKVDDDSEAKRKFKKLLRDFIKGRKIMLRRMKDIREAINRMLYKAENEWEYISKCLEIVNKKLRNDNK